jgi:hypothetical protein
VGRGYVEAVKTQWGRPLGRPPGLRGSSSTRSHRERTSPSTGFSP